jgi:hypothetical protein
MLEVDRTEAGIADTREFAPLKVILPKHLEKFFEERGYHPTTANENRHNSRVRVRSLANIEFVPPPVGMPSVVSLSKEKRGTVLIKDLSRTGIGLLYHRQILPGECFDVYFLNRIISAIAVRCRREARMCFETGANVTSVVTLVDADADEDYYDS